MSREILFKAKRLDNGDWVEGFPYWGEYSGAFILQSKAYRRRDARTGKISMGDEVVPVEVDPSTVCQYIGLTDKHGKKIFEGDILNEDGEPFTVVYDSNWAKFKLQYHHVIQYPEWNRGVLMEVIGNIHDGEAHEEE